MKMGYIVVMECGRAFVSIATGEDQGHCEGLAISAVKEVLDSQVYDTAGYPVESWHNDGITELDLAGFDA